jgi:hypothetical protein
MSKKVTDCQHPKHKEYLEAFLKEYPTANKDAHFNVNMVDPEEWYISDDSEKNTTKCCQMCSISEDIARTPYRNISTSSPNL